MNKEDKVVYGIILQDNRFDIWCTYSYTVAPLPHERVYEVDGGYTVYGLEPWQLNYCNNVEKVLYGL